MSEAEPLISSGGTDELDQYDIAEFTHRYRAALERARQHYEEYGVWPPDPLLDEVHAARREILAEHGNDWRKVIEHYIEEGETNSNSVVRIPDRKVMSRPAREEVGYSQSEPKRRMMAAPQAPEPD